MPPQAHGLDEHLVPVGDPILGGFGNLRRWGLAEEGGHWEQDLAHLPVRHDVLPRSTRPSAHGLPLSETVSQDKSVFLSSCFYHAFGHCDKESN
jgi:hypothetical protein